MEKNGFVIKVEGPLAHVSVIRPSECGDKCDSCSGSCNIQEMVVTVQNRLAANVGDRVALEMQSVQLIRMSFLLYTVPLIALVIGVALGYFLAGNWSLPADFVGLGFGLIAMAMAYVLVNRILHFSAKGGEEILTMVRCYHKEDIL